MPNRHCPPSRQTPESRAAAGDRTVPPRLCRRVGLTGAILLCLAPVAAATNYEVTDLVADVPGVATYTDPNLVSPWGFASSPTSPFWVADNGAGVTTLYNGSGQPQPLVVTIPPASGGVPPSSPTGVVFNGGADFEVAPGAPARFIFASEEGTISGWNPVSVTNAIREVDHSASGADYKGLAIGSNAGGNFLYAANFAAGRIDVFDHTFADTSLGGNFQDPNLPAGYAPFNIQNVGGNLLVTYALQGGGGHDPMVGPGIGIVDVFATDGSFLQRLVTGGALDAPWGLALAPAGFGDFSDDLLVGNFGDGRINAYNPLTGDYHGTLFDASALPVTIDGLWGLGFGNGGNGGDTSTLYFAAAPPGQGPDEAHGLFGSIAALGIPAPSTIPEPSTRLLFGLGLVGFSVAAVRRRCRG